MYNVGVFPGKFFPPHRGHLNAIIRAATQCDKLYVVVSDNMKIADDICNDMKLPPMPLALRAKWLSIELQEFEHVTILMLDETGIPPYPDGTVEWSKRLLHVMTEKFDAIFGGEMEYKDTYMRNFPDHVTYVVYDYERSKYPVSATNIREDYLHYWDYILGSARGFFSRRMLISGTESCGKTMMVKYLAKIHHTSWSVEYGRYYSNIYLGGNEALMAPSDFCRIAYEQIARDEDALKSSNKITFFDADAVVTQFYCKMYTGRYNDDIERFVDSRKYDVVIMLPPNVKWVADGLRWKSDQKTRERLHAELVKMYENRGFTVIKVKEDTYESRLHMVDDIASKMTINRKYMSRF